MKSTDRIITLLIFALIYLSTAEISAQEEKQFSFNSGADIYSSYIWRGTRFGKGPALQPKLEFKTGRFTAGAWGSFDFNGYQETDLYFSFSLPAGISLGATDYYYPDFDYFDYSTVSGSHAFEISLGFSKGGLALSANYILNEAGHAGSEGSDKYFEVKYSFDAFNLFAGAGDGWHTVDGNFTVCNIGLGTSRTIKITDSFSIPVTGQLIFNPDREQMYIVVGFTL